MGVHKSGQVLKPAFHHVMQLKEVCPLKWTSAEINVLSCNAAERGVSTKVDKH